MLGNTIQTTIRTILRSLKRQPLYASLNIIGLALGLGATVLILSFVRMEWSFDSDVPAIDDVYRVDLQTVNPDGVPEDWAGVPIPLAPALDEETDLVEAATRVMIRRQPARLEGRTPVSAQVIYTDRAFFDVLATVPDPFEDGWAPEQVIVSRSMAARLGVGRGDLIRIEESGTERDLTVEAISPDAPPNSSFGFDIIASIDSYPGNEQRSVSWTSWVSNAYVRLAPGTKSADMDQILSSFTDSRMEDMHRTWRMLEWVRDDGNSFELALTPLADMHLMPEVQVVHTPVSDPAYLRILLGLGIGLLLIACINFTTLSVGRATRRAREVGVRKVLGATRPALIGQFLTEAVLMSGLAVAGAILVAEAFGPTFADMVGAETAPAVVDSVGAALLLGGLVLVTGLVAGAYPAVVLSRFDSRRAVASALKTNKRNPWMQALVTFQFAASILLLIGVFAASEQLEHLQTRDLGYEPDHVVVAPISFPDAESADRFVDQLRGEAQRIPGVIDVAGSSTGLAGGLSWNSFTTSEGARYVYTNRIDLHFMDMMRMDVVEGRGFDEARPSDAHNAVLVNEALVREFGWDDSDQAVIGRRMPGIDLVEGAEQPEVIGVVRDFHFKSLHTAVEPMVFFLAAREPTEAFEYVWLKLGPDERSGTLDRVAEAWARLDPGSSFDWAFLDDALADRYAEDERTRRTAGYAAVFAILIACLGLFGLAAFSAERRTKEIGIRKVLGATAGRLSLLMSAEFGLLVLAANAIALPVGWILIDRWLDTYVYRIELGAGMLAAAAGISFVVAMAVVFSQVHRTSLKNPVDSLRAE